MNHLFAIIDKFLKLIKPQLFFYLEKIIFKAIKMSSPPKSFRKVLSEMFIENCEPKYAPIKNVRDKIRAIFQFTCPDFQ